MLPSFKFFKNYKIKIIELEETCFWRKKSAKCWIDGGGKHGEIQFEDKLWNFEFPTLTRYRQFGIWYMENLTRYRQFANYWEIRTSTFHFDLFVRLSLFYKFTFKKMGRTIKIHCFDFFIDFFPFVFYWNSADGIPASTPASIPHSSEPRRILKNPFIPQSLWWFIICLDNNL